MKRKNDGQKDLIPAEPEQTEFFEVGTSRPDPQRGFPELWWKGKRPFNGVHYYPAQHKESHGEAVDGWRNRLYWGDNLQVMGHLLRKFRGTIDFVYIDPPFDSKADYKKKVVQRAGVASSDGTAFEERQYSDLWTNDEYLQFMYERLYLLRELLSSTGSIVLHCDWHKMHHLRCLMDEVFGDGGGDGRAPGFKNEIVWRYRTFQGQTHGYFPRKHDTLLWYTKGVSFTYNQLFDTQLADTIDGKRWKSYMDGSGQILGGNMPTQDSRFVRYLNKWKKQHGREPEAEDVVYEALGQPIDSVWDMKGLDPKSSERIGYPTQKPELLLERIILGLTEPGALVLDCFAGSGTTLACASRLGRRFIGSDINQGAITTTIHRLRSLGEVEPRKESPAASPPGFDVFIVNQYEVFRNELEARELLLEAIGVRPLAGGALWHGELGEGTETRQVRVMPVNRIATKADLAPIVQNLDYRELACRRVDAPKKPVERITLLCMGHEPDIAAELITEIRNSLNDPGCKVDIEVVDILRDKDHIQFKRDSEAKITVKRRQLRIERFFPMNLLQKLSMEKAAVSDWRELVDSVLIDFNFDGAVLRPTVSDIPARGEMVAGEYEIPDGAGTIRVKITDVLSDVFEASVEVNHG